VADGTGPGHPSDRSRIGSPPAFANVLKKFFTDWFGYENNLATSSLRKAETIHDTQTDLRTILSRARGTILQDLAGGLSLVILLLVGLNLPGFV
jgi:hypothetical protein